MEVPFDIQRGDRIVLEVRGRPTGLRLTVRRATSHVSVQADLPPVAGK